MQRVAGIAVGDTVTLSASVNGTVYIKSVTITDSETAYNMGAFYFICGYNSDSAFFEIAITSDSISVEWTKVEKGSVATPYVPKAFGDEFLECLRYFYSTVGVWTRIVTQTQYNGALQLMGFFPVTMRTVPTLAVNGTYQKNVSGATVKPIEIGTNDIMPIGFSVYIPTGEITTDFFVKYNYTASADL